MSLPKSTLYTTSTKSQHISASGHADRPIVTPWDRKALQLLLHGPVSLKEIEHHCRLICCAGLMVRLEGLGVRFVHVKRFGRRLIALHSASRERAKELLREQERQP